VYYKILVVTINDGNFIVVMDDRLKTIPLRERKFALTRLALRDAMLERIQTVPFDAISVKELCEAVQISEGTFYNYFPEKSDLLIYFIQLWSIEVFAHARSIGKSGFDLIEAVFEYTARQIRTNRSAAIMLEIIAHQATLRKHPQIKEITAAERIIAFPQFEDTLDLPANGLSDILETAIEQAIRKKEISRSVDTDGVIALLASLFFGMPIVLRSEGIAALETCWSYGLRILKQGLQKKK